MKSVPALVTLALILSLTTPPGEAQTPYQTALEGTELLGEGVVKVYQKDDDILIALPPEIFQRLFLWHAEAVGLPTEAVSRNGTKVGTTVVAFERQGSRVLMRNLAASYAKRAGDDDPSIPDPDPTLQINPIQHALDDTTIGPVLSSLPVIASHDDGTLLVSIEQSFESDFDGLSARSQVISAGLRPQAIMADRSYIARIQVFPDNLLIRSHLTFLAIDELDPDAGPRPVSLEVAHSLVLLPETPMPERAFDPRVGFFQTSFTAFETSGGQAVEKRAVIFRHRLEKTDPDAALSDPLKPITFYIDRGVPDRWRPYIKAGVEDWQPAFEAAGFSNAIIARDAPTPEENPDWSRTDPRYSVIRWIPQPYPNAMGPVIYDPRSGEILSAHVLIWPQVIEDFSRLYYALAKGVDPEVDGLPLSIAKQGELLRYITAHEVGHTLGLRHNNLASTAYSVKNLRDPEFANRHGPNASIMAYGRFNQVAQPGDGVTRVLAVLGPWDYFAIDWGYGSHGQSRDEEQEILTELAASAARDPLLRWAAGESLDAWAWKFDPRLQTENVASERVEATRLGVAKVVRSVISLGDAVGDDDLLFAQTVRDISLYHLGFLKSVITLVGGVQLLPTEGNGQRLDYVPAAEQRAAVDYLLGPGAASLNVYARPALLARAQPIGGLQLVETHRAALVKDLLAGSRLALLEMQGQLHPEGYDLLAFAGDVSAAIWDDLGQTPAWRRTLQQAYLERAAEILDPPAAQPDQAQIKARLTQQGLGPGVFEVMTASGAQTAFPGWLRNYLPRLRTRLAAAAEISTEPAEQIHYREMARLIEIMLQTSG